MTNPDVISLKECLTQSQNYAADLEGKVNGLTTSLERETALKESVQADLASANDLIRHLNGVVEQVGLERDTAREIADAYRQERAARIKAQNQAERAQNQANDALGDWQVMKDKVEHLEAAVAEGNPAKVASLQVEIDRLRSLARADARAMSDAKAEEDRLIQELNKAENLNKVKDEANDELAQQVARLQAELTTTLNRERHYISEAKAYKEKAEAFENLADQRWLEIREFEDVRKGYGEGIKVWQNRALEAENKLRMQEG